MSKPVIEVHGIAKDYFMGDMVVHALRDVDLTIEEGDFIAIMGPSGSGKSTFMNLIGCLDRPTRGEYTLNGTEPPSQAAIERACAVWRAAGLTVV